MKKIIKKILFIGLIIFLLMQLYQPARNISFEQNITADFTKVYNVPKNVEVIFRTSCYDCHSNNTFYPWYSYIQPTRFFMESHINEGKENLNFNEWGNYSGRKQKNKLDRIAKQIKSNEMPLASYTLIHKNATLSATQKKEVLDWINKIENSL
jgi:hypothetical protein